MKADVPAAGGGLPRAGSVVPEDELVARAARARQRAYAPYSGFAVGAAVLTRSGEVFTGCNVENASFGLTVCAERVALLSAVAAGHRDFLALAVVADTDGPCSPCGACRQVMAEFGDFPVILAGLRGGRTVTTVSALLPGAFRLSEGRGAGATGGGGGDPS